MRKEIAVRLLLLRPISFSTALQRIALKTLINSNIAKMVRRQTEMQLSESP